MNQKIRVFIADDHPVFRQGLRQVLQADPGLTLVGEAGDGTAALAGILKLHPDIALLDIELPGLDGLDLARTLQKSTRPVAVILLTMSKEESVVNAALDLGVKGYLVKDHAATDIIQAVKSVAEGNIFLSPSISGYLLKRHQRANALRQRTPGLSDLSPMERRVLELLAQNKTSKEIGEALFISHRTVETHCANIRVKLDLRGPHRLLQFAIEHKSDL